MVLKLSEQVRRLEDSIESLRAENKKLKAKVHESEVIKKPMFNYKGTYTVENGLPTSGNKDGDLWICNYTYCGQDMHSDSVRYKDRWISPIEYEKLFKVNLLPDKRDEIIDHQKWEISKLKTELSARLKQVEDLQSSYKNLQEENKKLKSKLEQTVDEYDEDYQTFHKIKDDDINYDKRLKQHMREIMKSRLDDMFNKGRW